MQGPGNTRKSRKMTTKVSFSISTASSSVCIIWSYRKWHYCVVLLTRQPDITNHWVKKHLVKFWHRIKVFRKQDENVNIYCECWVIVQIGGRQPTKHRALLEQLLLVLLLCLLLLLLFLLFLLLLLLLLFFLFVVSWTAAQVWTG